MEEDESFDPVTRPINIQVETEPEPDPRASPPVETPVGLAQPSDPDATLGEMQSSSFGFGKGEGSI